MYVKYMITLKLTLIVRQRRQLILFPAVITHSSLIKIRRNNKHFSIEGIISIISVFIFLLLLQNKKIFEQIIIINIIIIIILILIYVFYTWV